MVSIDAGIIDAGIIDGIIIFVKKRRVPAHHRHDMNARKRLIGFIVKTWRPI